MMFTDVFIKRPVLATVVSLLILLLGLRALNNLPLRQFPEMQNTVISITTSYPGASAALIQGFITSPIEKVVASANGVDYLTSESADGTSTIHAYIRLNFNPNEAMTEITTKVAQVKHLMPKESNPPVITKATGAQIDLMYIGFSSAAMTTQQITDYVSHVVQPKLQTAPGVANAEILGGFNYAMRIWLNTEKMAALHITPDEVATALLNENVQTAAGEIKGNYVLFAINAKTNLETPEQFKNIVIKQQNNTLIRLQDIAQVELGSEFYDASVVFNGKTAVFVGIQSTPTANPLTVIDNVKKVLPELSVNYPPGMESKIVYDSTDYIRSSINEVIHSIVEATLIVIFVIFIFLGAIRTVTIPIVTIPLSLIGVCSLLLAMNYSINLLTLLALVIAIGLVVDDAIVVVENIYRHIENGMTPIEAATRGAREIATPIISMTTTLAAVYIPIGFMTGLTGALFKEFAFTLAFAVIISGIVALTLSPMMCSKILTPALTQQRLVHYIDELFEKIKSIYQIYLMKVLNNRPVAGVFAIIVFLSCFLMLITTPTELAPTEDKSVLFLSLTAPKSTNFAYLTKFTNELNKVFKKIPDTQDYFIINGAGEVNNAIAGLILKPWDKRKNSQDKIHGQVQQAISQIAGVNAVAFPLPSIPGSNDGLPLQFVITATEDYAIIAQVLEKLQTAAMQSGLFMFLDADLKFDKPVVDINIDRDKAGSIGLSMQTISNALTILFGGGNINRFNLYGNSYYVIPQALQEFRITPHKIDDIYVSTTQGHKIPLSTVVTLKIKTDPSKLNQFQQLNSATLQGMMMPGRTITEGLEFLRNQAKQLFPIGFSYDYAGQSRQIIQEGYSMVYTFFFALIIIYLVLSAQFESFRDPFIILISVPLSIAGALIPLHIGLATLNIYTGIGLVTLIGLISKHGILMVDFANHLQREENLSIFDAIIKSASLRLRPILMTTAAMILGVIPLITAAGAGAESRFNIGLVIASGMLIGTCFTLFIVPTMYTFFAKKLVTAG
ncbi:MAG: multidrug efflux protein [Gammaproteobacteria bacterium RIFCSPHIGHO2_12_FULL_41_20]|nr:MAG: multidrug efflux protein [Gammaproteobacteria bacterium RIFCSPHIGHO2_12_FULL_41_20]